MREIKPTIIQQAGGTILVKYPYKKCPDLYLAFKEHPIHCCQCEKDIESNGDKFIEHIISHSNRKHHRFICAMQPDLISGCQQFGELIRTRQE